MIPTGQYLIDDQDWYTTYGWVTAPGGSNDFLKFYDSKEVYSFDWADQNGADVNLDTRYFKPKSISIKGALLADNEDDFWNKHTGLFNLLSAPGLRRIYISEFKRFFYVYYTGCTDFDRFTRILVEDDGEKEKIACQYTLQFIEPTPTFWEQYPLLVTQNDYYITTNNNDKILITT